MNTFLVIINEKVSSIKETYPVYYYKKKVFFRTLKRVNGSREKKLKEPLLVLNYI